MTAFERLQHREFDLFPVWVDELPWECGTEHIETLIERFPEPFHAMEPARIPRLVPPPLASHNAPTFNTDASPAPGPSPLLIMIKPEPEPRLGWSFAFQSPMPAPLAIVSKPIFNTGATPATQPKRKLEAAAIEDGASPVHNKKQRVSPNSSLNGSGSGSSSIYCDDSSIDSIWNECAMIRASKRPILDALLLCLNRKIGARVTVWTQREIEIDVFDFEKLLRAIDRLNKKRNPTNNVGNRVKTLRRWFSFELTGHSASEPKLKLIMLKMALTVGDDGSESEECSIESESSDGLSDIAPMQSSPEKGVASAIMNGSGTVESDDLVARNGVDITAMLADLKSAKKPIVRSMHHSPSNPKNWGNAWVKRSKNKRKTTKNIHVTLTANTHKKNCIADIRRAAEHLGLKLNRERVANDS